MFPLCEKLLNSYVFVNVVGGLKINEPAADLAVALAVISAYKEIEFTYNFEKYFWD